MKNIHNNRPRRRLPSLRMLRAFEAAAHHGSITQAAAELNVTHSAISHQVKALEAYLGAALIQRQGRKIVLTAAGQAYYPELAAALDRMAQATDRIAYQQPRAALTVSVTSSFATRWLIPRLASFCKTYPDIDVRLATTEKMFEFNPQLFDASIRSLTESELRALQKRRDWENMHAEPFLEESHFPVCHPELLRDKPLATPADLRQHTLLHTRSVPRAWREWLSAARVKGIDPDAGLTFDHFHLSLQAAARGMGVAIGSRPLVQDDLANGTLVIPLPGIESQFERYYVIYSKTATHSPDIDAFCKWLLAEAQAPQESPQVIDDTPAPKTAAKRKVGLKPRRNARR